MVGKGRYVSECLVGMASQEGRQLATVSSKAPPTASFVINLGVVRNGSMVGNWHSKKAETMRKVINH